MSWPRHPVLLIYTEDFPKFYRDNFFFWILTGSGQIFVFSRHHILDFFTGSRIFFSPLDFNGLGLAGLVCLKDTFFSKFSRVCSPSAYFIALELQKWRKHFFMSRSESCWCNFQPIKLWHFELCHLAFSCFNIASKNTLRKGTCEIKIRRGWFFVYLKRLPS